MKFFILSIVAAIIYMTMPSTGRSQNIVDRLLGEVLNETSRSYRTDQKRSRSAQTDRRRSTTAEDSLTVEQRKLVQAELNRRGYNVGRPDGVFGRGTRGGIRLYRQARGSHAVGPLTANEIEDLLAAGSSVAAGETVSCVDSGSTAAMAAAIGISASNTRVRMNEHSSLTLTLPAYSAGRRAFVVVSTENPVRFRGEGFYALMPGARAPFDFPFAHDKTRVILPLNVRDRANSITVEIVPLALGATPVEVSLVEPASCEGEIFPVRARFEIYTSPGIPVITIHDEFASVRPEHTYLSADGDRIIEQYRDRFRLIDTASGAQIREAVGNLARFSRSGRFIGAYDAAGMNIYDALDGALIHELGGVNDLAWDNQDSFIVTSGLGQGAIAVGSALVERSSMGTVASSCRICGGLGDVSFRFDIENNVLASFGSLGDSAISLTSTARYDTAWGDKEANLARYGSLAGFVNWLTGMADWNVPPGANVSDHLSFTHFGLIHYEVDGIETPFDAAVVAGSDFVEQAGSKDIVIPQPLPAGDSIVGLSRGAVSTRADRPAPSRVLSRIREIFGWEAVGKIAFEKVNDPFVDVAPSQYNEVFMVGEYRYDPRIRVDPAECQEAVRFGDILQIGARYSSAWSLLYEEERISLIGGGCLGGSAGYSTGIIALHSSLRPGELLDLSFRSPIEEEANPGIGCLGECDFHAALAWSRFIVIWSKDSRLIEIFDRESHRRYTLPAFRGELMEEVWLAADGLSLLQVNEDGSFAFHLLSSGLDSSAPDEPVEEEISDTAVIYGSYSDDELVIWNKWGRFDATYEGSFQVSLRFPGSPGVFSIDQFDSKLRYPGLLAAALAGNEVRSEELALPPLISVRMEQHSDRLSFKVDAANPDGVTQLLVYQDGLHTDTKTTDPADAEHNLEVSALSGARWATLIAVNADGLASSPTTFAVESDIPMVRKYAVLAIGVDRYDDPALPRLFQAERDASRVKNLFKERDADSGDNGNVSLMGPDATRNAVLAAVDKIASDSSPEVDTVVFFAGHGLRGTEGDLFLALADTRTSDLAATSASWSAVAQRLRSAKGRVVVLLDTCHSGEAGRTFLASNDEVVESMLAQGDGNLVVLSASKGREQALESPVFGGGLFTTAVVEVISDQAKLYDANQNGALEASEFYRGVKDIVQARSDQRQTPWIARNNMIGNFSLF